MDPSSAFLRPRLRLSRRSPSPAIPDAAATPPARALFAARLDDDDEAPTPRVQPRPIDALDPDPSRASFPAAAVPGETPAARLRALLAREPRSPRNTSPPSSDAESAAGPSRLGSSTSSVARESLKDIFSRALREPGDTPQKGRMRRNSFDGSSLEITPVVNNERRHRRAARRSLSDEEAEKPKSNRQSVSSFRLPTAAAFDTLRARLASSQSQIIDQNLPEALYDHTSIASTSTSNAQPHPRPSTSSQLNSTRLTPPPSNTTPYPSFQLSSQLGFPSNLLEQDSEMQRVMGDVLVSESEASTSAKNFIQSTAIPSDSRPSSLRGSNSELQHRRSSHELHSSTNPSANDRADCSQEEDRNHQRRSRLPSRSSTPEIHHKRSQESHRRLSTGFRSPSHVKSLSHEAAVGPVHRHRERRDSLASLRSFDDERNSRPSSTSSQADYRERISELDRERNHERERQWNRRHPSRPSSSLSTNSSHSPSHSHSHSHTPRSPSATPYLSPTHASLQRKSSRTSLRSDSPASLASSLDSLKEREQEETKEIVHERERNWNSPRPQWPLSKSPSTSHLKSRNKDNSPLRATSSLTHVGNSNGHQDASQVPTKRHSTSPKADASVVSPASRHKPSDPSDSGLNEDALGTTPSTPSNGFSAGKRAGAASKFGWNFARSPLPPLELDDRHKGASSTSFASRPSSAAQEASVSSYIPVRSRMKSFSSVGHATSDMSLTHIVGDESSFQPDYQSEVTEVAELRGRGEPPSVSDSRSQGDMLLASDEESVVDSPLQSTTPKSNPPNLIPEEIETDTETEVLTSPSQQGSPQLGAPTFLPDETPLQKVDDPPRSQTSNPTPEKPSAGDPPPGTPPSTSAGSQLPNSEMSPSFSLITPPRPTSFGSSVLDFRTPSPPRDLPDLPGPPSSSDDDALGDSPMKDRRVDANAHSTLTKTPRPPGAWAATPLPSKIGRRSSSPMSFFPLESTPPASTSTPLVRANSLPHTRIETGTDGPGEDELLTPVGILTRAKPLPSRTPAPPGAWLATPGQSMLLSNGTDQSQYGSLSRRKGLLRVRFDVTESEASATEGHSNSPISAIRLTNPGLPLSEQAIDRGNDNIKVVANGAPQPGSTSRVSQRPTTPDRPTTPTDRDSRSPRSLRKSPSVRLVDAYGRERVDEGGSAESSSGLANGRADAERKATTPPSTPRRSLVRIVDAMGKEVGDAVQTPDPPEGRANRLLEADVSVASDDTPIEHAEALARMRKTLRDLAESLSDADRSEDLVLNSSHLEQLEEVSKAARLARNQLAQNLHLEAVKQHDPRPDSDVSAWTRQLLPVTTKRPWNTTIIYCGIIVQLLIILAMWRYAHMEARRLFHTTYYDPLYPEFSPIQGSSCFNSGTLSTSRSWTMLDSYETIRREGWHSIWNEIIRAARHIGDQAWERWGEQTHLERPT